MDQINKGGPRFVAGYHAIGEYIKKGGEAILHVAVRNKRTEEILLLAQQGGVRIRRCEEKDLDRLVPQGHRGLVLELLGPRPQKESSLESFLSCFQEEQGLVLLLDGVTDAHNFGALLRSADLFRVDGVIIPTRRSAREDAATARISSGASAFVRVFPVPNLVRTLGSLKDAGFWIYGAHMGGEPAHEARLGGRIALVLGSEGRGLSRLVKENCDALLKIPSAGHVDSFNVSVAGGILMYEIRRQQNFPRFPSPP